MASSSQPIPAIPPVPPNIASIAAPQLLGALFNYALYGVLLMQIYIYRLSFPKDNLTIKCLVYFIFCFETAATVMNGVDIYNWFEVGFGNVLTFADPRLSVFYTPIMGSVMALIVQGYFCYRIFIFKRTIWWWYTLIALVSLLQAAAGIAGGIRAHISNDVAERQKNVVLVYLWLVGDAVADIMIATTMTYILTTSSNKSHRQTQDIVNRIVRLVVETNALSASVAIVSLILFAGVPNTTYFITPTLVLGKLYANTLLVTFNNRAFLARKMNAPPGVPESAPNHWSRVQSNRSSPFSAGLTFSDDKDKTPRAGGVSITVHTDASQ